MIHRYQVMTRFHHFLIDHLLPLVTEGAVIRDQETSMFSNPLGPSCAHFDADRRVLCTSTSRPMTIESCPPSTRPLIRAT